MLNRIRPPFNMNTAAQAAAAACIDDAVFLERVYKENRAGVETLETFFKEQEIRYLPTTANFVLAQTGPKTAELNTELLKRGVIVRPVKSYGLPDWLRVSVGTARKTRALLKPFRPRAKRSGLFKAETGDASCVNRNGFNRGIGRLGFSKGRCR